MTSTKSKSQSAPARGRRAATIHDVAAKAGVSVATVSRVLNGSTVVRETTSERVRAVATRLRYVPNVAARSLSIRRSHTIGVVLPDIHGEFFSEIIRGIDVAARGAGYHILVSGSHSDPQEMLEVIETMRGRVDGMIVMSPDVEITMVSDQLSHGLPLVLLNAASREHDAITIDNHGGSAAMVAHLRSSGHTNIAFITGPVRNADAGERLRGYREAIRRGTPRAKGVECTGDFSEASGFEAARRIVAATPRPSAIFAANDAMAVGAIAAIVDAGLSVPHDVAVVGFDDIPIARYLAPPLTTIRVDMAALGRRSFELLLQSITGKRHRSRQECIPTSLVIRQSCGASTAGTHRKRTIS